MSVFTWRVKLLPRSGTVRNTWKCGPPLELQDRWRREDLGERATKKRLCRALSNSGVGSEESYRFLK